MLTEIKKNYNNVFKIYIQLVHKHFSFSFILADALKWLNLKLKKINKTYF